MAIVTYPEDYQKALLVALPIPELPGLMGKVPFAKTFLLMSADIVSLTGNLVLES